MKRIVSILAAALTLLVSCSKEMREEQAPSPTPEAGQGKTVLTVTSAFTKTTLGDLVDGSRQIYWADGDCINVNGNTSDALSGVAANTDKTASFVFDNEGITAPYNTVYPASIYTSESTVTLPAEAADGIVPLAGTGSESPISLGALTSMLKVSVTNPESSAKTITQIKVSSDGTRLSGAFVINYGSCTLTPAPNPAGADTTVYIAGSWALAKDATRDFFIPLPAGTYGITVVITYSDDNTLILGPTPEVEFEKGSIIVSPEVSNVFISSAEELVAFATAYNRGDYASYGSNLKVTVTKNLVFDATSSADFNATGGIGQKNNVNGATGDNYFPGIFDGGNHTISGLEATVPIFAFTDSESTIENLTIASTSSMTINSPDIYDVHGVLVGRGKGLIKNCIVNANVVINNIQDVSSNEQHYGGIVGRNYGGTIDNCTMNGNITCSQTGQTITTNKTNIGGIAGTQAAAGSVVGSIFKGNIIISDGTTYGGITANSLYFYIGGIVGYATDGNISRCTAGESGTATEIDLRATSIPAVGGIAGWLSTNENSKIEYSTNYMSLSVANNGARANTTPIRIGGIVGYTAADVSYCDNYGTISSVSNSTTAYLGGIAATGRKIDHCNNYISGSITRTNAEAATTQTNRYMYIGGILGAPNAAADIETCTNKASVTSNMLGTSEHTTIDMGGIVGGGGGYQIDIDSCNNEGEVKLENDNASASVTTRNAIGGVVGYASTAESTVKGCGNKGKVWCKNNVSGAYGYMSLGGTIGRAASSCSVTDCTNSGEILCQNPGNAITAYVDLGGIVGFAEQKITIEGTAVDKVLNSGPVTVSQENPSALYARNTQGGILGFGQGNDTKIKNCKNEAKIFCSLSGVKSNGRSSYTGGIVGLLASMTYTDNVATGLSTLTGLEIDSCNNAGDVTSSNYSNSTGNKASPFAGGIVGLVSGRSSSMASIHDCSVASSVVLYAYRGFSGGIAGYANYCSLSKNTSSANMSGTNASVNGVGGIAGRLFDSSMDDCTFSGKIAKALNIGGLVYTMNEQESGSTITNCNVNGAVLTTGTGTNATGAAVLVSIAYDKTNTISGCGVKGTLDGAAITLSSRMITTNGGGATVTGTYLLP